MVEMQIRLPVDMPIAEADDLSAHERDVAQKLQRDGRWRHLWRVAGRYANVSIFDVDSPDELHELISSLPRSPYLDIRVTPLARIHLPLSNGRKVSVCLTGQEGGEKWGAGLKT